MPQQINLDFSQKSDLARDLYVFERQLWEKGHQFIAGVDEAGRGPLAGPVYAAAVIFPQNIRFDEIDDSKKLTSKKREQLFPKIYESAVAVGIGKATHEEIDRINVLQASLLAMNRAVENLSQPPDFLLIDGNQMPRNDLPKMTIVKGDSRSISIAAASIIAKVTRDRVMIEYDQKWPEYGFARHKGYGTKAHREAIQKYGYSPIHRKSFHIKNLSW